MILWIIDGSTGTEGPGVASETPEFITAVCDVACPSITSLIALHAGGYHGIGGAGAVRLHCHHVHETHQAGTRLYCSCVSNLTQLLHHTASDSFLIQSYLSTVLLFAGTYTLLFRVCLLHCIHCTDIGRWTRATGTALWCVAALTAEAHVLQLGTSTTAHAWVLSLFVQMLYYSVTVMTTTGVRCHVSCLD